MEQTTNGHRKLQNTTSLSVPAIDDEMIDITPRDTMDSANFERQSNSPIHHSNSFVRERELNDAEGMF